MTALKQFSTTHDHFAPVPDALSSGAFGVRVIRSSVAPGSDLHLGEDCGLFTTSCEPRMADTLTGARTGLFTTSCDPAAGSGILDGAWTGLFSSGS
ncbi:DUF6749 domain-containing protein [Sulfitobacter sp. D35]|uniref:DUF6749 domain-containing protein n=1 Tax=Sulfitobacter sp. D35 TaxID=3083252 RepID=UPI00296F596C|nr:DUF6749 domain-containing protein [Sulfitobacter sp. D35]MDW4497572.1 DUF6749 domain-containing protein [Sulfitobacter sp. D35]